MEREGRHKQNNDGGMGVFRSIDTEIPPISWHDFANRLLLFTFIFAGVLLALFLWRRLWELLCKIESARAAVWSGSTTSVPDLQLEKGYSIGVVLFHGPVFFTSSLPTLAVIKRGNTSGMV